MHNNTSEYTLSFREKMTEITYSLRVVPVFLFLCTEFVSLRIVFGVMNSNASNSNEMTGCILRERRALLTFREGLEDPFSQIPAWVGQDCCRWEGVICSKRTGRVVKLDLSNRGLNGKISPSLLEFKQLHYLDLSMNFFQGISIPSFLGSLEKLIHLNLSRTYFTGLVPPHLGNLSNLRFLDLSGDFGIGSLHSSDLHWLSRLSSLEYINLGFVNLSLATPHWLQALNMLPSLSELHLPNCDLHTLPSSLPNLNFTSLSVVDLSENYFNSSVPQWLLNMSSSLVELDLVSCLVKGIFSHVANGDFCNFQRLGLQGNEIKGEISEFITGLSKCNNNTLRELKLSGNLLYGQFPTESLEHLNVKLRSLYLDYNSISGPLPASIKRLSNLEILDLDGNRMNGSFPESLGNLTNLVELNLGNNSWEGTISQNMFAGLTKLKELRISSSSPKPLFCNLSNGWIPPFSLQVLEIRNCQLGPKFPAWLQTQSQLNFVVLTDASISDTIPHWFWKISPQIIDINLSRNQIRGVLPNLLEFPTTMIIDLSSNCLEGPLPLWNVPYLILKKNLFSGSIPVKFGDIMSSSQVLDLSWNSLSGSIPSSFSKMLYIEDLLLSNNKLSGNIPDQWGDLQQLELVDLSSNSLTGNIPNSLCSLSSLGWLKLSRNHLSGELSLSLRNCTSLAALDLGDNRFFGKIPEWIDESFSSLSELRMRGNMFTGEIPQQLCRLPQVHILDFALNMLSGSIPPCLGNLSGLIRIPTVVHAVPFPRALVLVMELDVKGREDSYSSILGIVNIINLAYNNLRGKIPKEFTNLLLLGTLNLSHNQLTGKIPAKIGDLSQLETLDLSSNRLSGPIPLSMSSMTLLSHLNMSRNNFSGPIPSANQFLTFNDASNFEDNPGLCGGPLPKKCVSSHGVEGNHTKAENDEDKYEKLGFYVSMAAGFATGFWAVCGSLVIKESWRHAFFRFMDTVKDWLIVHASVYIARLRRMN